MHLKPVEEQNKSDQISVKRKKLIKWKKEKKRNNDSLYWFFGGKTKTDKPLAKLSKERKAKIHKTR